MTETAQEFGDGTPAAGEILAGKYRVERVLGEGGMGVVVAAEHLLLHQTVAVKLLLPEAMERSDSIERFLREGRAAAAIKSDHIARVFDVGTLDSGRPFIVMEYLVGQELGDVQKERGTLPIPEAVDHVLQACEAIAEAHALGIVHRDLKPANLFVTRRNDGTPFVKVLDFGLSKVAKTDALEPSLTSADTVLGSPNYMSPEQVRSLKTIDARSDIWSLGVILYELLAGHRPFEEPSLGSLFVMIGAEPPASIRKHLPDIPPDLEAILLKCLEKAPANRFQTVADLARALAPFATDAGRVSIERIARVVNPPAAPPSPAARPSARTANAPPPSDPSAQSGNVQPEPDISNSLATPANETAVTSARPAQQDGSKIALVVLAALLALVAGAATVLLVMRGAGMTAPASGDTTASPASPSVTATASAPATVSSTTTGATTAPTSTASAGTTTSAAPAAPPSSSSKKRAAPAKK